MAIGWTIPIMAVAVAIAFAGPSLDSDSSLRPDYDAPTAKEATTTQETKPSISGWERAESSQDPGIGHEAHQLAVLLAPSEDVYSGMVRYDASEPVQIVTLHGPLAEDEERGQIIWTPDGGTKFAWSIVDTGSEKGEWKFAGNALALHTFNREPFIVDYTIDLDERPVSMGGTIDSVQDMGLGHEKHQLAMILQPSEYTYSGILAYSSSEQVQLVSLRGPVGMDENPVAIWTPDGSSIFEITLVDPKTSMGIWEFSGNALAVHTMFPDTFSVSYSVSAERTP